MKEKKIVIPIHIDHKWVAKVLDNCGYYRHWKGRGWVKEEVNQKRFHACWTDYGIELHMDLTTKDNFHKVATGTWKQMVVHESRRINKAWKEINPEEIAKREELERKKKLRREKGFKTEYAPNLRELQKKANKLNPTWKLKLKAIIKSLT